MDGSRFAHELATWLQPGIIARVAEETGTPEASTSTTLQFRARSFQDAKHSGLNILFDQYLDNFKVPPSLLRIATLYRPGLSESVWQQLSETRFTGTRSYRPAAAPSVAGTQVAEIVGPLRETRLLQWPLAMLTLAVDELVESWKSILQRHQPQRLHHDNRAEWPLFAYLDTVVLQSMGNEGILKAGQVAPDFDQLKRYGRARSVVGPFPPTPERIEGARILFALGLAGTPAFVSGGPR